MNVLFTFDGNDIEFLSAMAAVRGWVESHADNRASVLTASAAHATALQGAWFLRRSGGQGDPHPFAAVDFDAIVDLKCDHAAAKEAELAVKAERRDLIDQMLLDYSSGNKLAAARLPKPKGYEALTDGICYWHRTHGYAHAIGEALGRQYGLEDFSPFLPQLPGMRKIANNYIRQHPEVKPGQPFIIVSDIDYFEDHKADVVYPTGWGLAYAEDMDLVTLASLACHKLASAVIGRVCPATYLGWAAAVPLVVEAIDGLEDVLWNASRCAYAYQVNMGEEGAAENFAQSLAGLYAARLGLEITL